MTALKSGAGLLAVKKKVTPDEWIIFFEELKLDISKDGLLGLGKISRIRKREMHLYQKERPDINYKSLGENDLNEAFIIDLIEPGEKNIPALGLDTATELNRRHAAEYSRDTGLPAITDTISLVQDSSRQPGFLLFYPAYTTGPEPQSVQERRARLVGWTYAPVVLQDFFTAIFSQKEFSELGYEIYNTRTPGTAVAKSARFFPEESDLVRTLKIDIFNQSFQFKIAKSPNLVLSEDTIASWVAVFSTILTLVLAAFIINSLSVGKKKPKNLPIK